MNKLVIYPGRFQPFHKGHAQVYQWLKKKFGNVVIATSNKVEAPKSPFNFAEKKRMMMLAGIPEEHIKQVLNPYMAKEVLKDYDPKKTVLIFAVSQKDMEEDPRFSFKPLKSGKPGYLQPYKGNEDKLQPFGDAEKMRGYVVVTPTFTFDVLGKPATSASELRKQFVSLNHDKQKAFITDLFGKYSASIHKLMDKKIGEMLGKPKTIKQLREEISHKEFGPMLDSFVAFASDHLGLKSMPKVRYKNSEDDYNSFAAYNPSKHELSVMTKNRHPMDVFRSVAHELVHHKQKEEDRIGKDVAKEGETGSDIENEANAKAGVIMRMFAKEHPDMFGKSYVVETNTAAMGGGVRGLGNVTGEVSPDGMSQYVLDNETYTKEIQNSTSGLYTLDLENSWLDPKGISEYQKRATKGFKAVRAQLSEGINDPGKLKAIFLAGGPGSGKDYVMNSVLTGEGLREINSDTAFEFLMKKHNLDMEMPDEERVERDIVRGRAKSVTKEKERLALAGRLGLIINGTADDLEKIKTIKKNLEADGYETMMVFVNTSNEVSRQRNVDRGKGGGRKVPDGTDKNGVPDGSADIRQEKWDAAQKNIGELQKIFGNNSFAVIDNSVDIRKATPEIKSKVQDNFNRVRRMAQQFVRAENQNPSAQKWIERETEKRGITQYQEPKRYKTLTQVRQNIPQVIHKPDNELMTQARRLGLSYYGFGRFGRKINGANTVLYHSKGGKLVRTQLNEDLRKWFREKWVRFDTKGNIKGPCARGPGEGKPKCRPLASARAMDKEERAKSARRKRREDPVADRPGKGGKPINVQTEAKTWAQQAAIAIAKKKSGKYNKEGKRIDEHMLTEKNVPTNPQLWSKAKSLAKSKFDVYPSAYANGWASKWYKSKGGGWKSQANESCWDGYKQEGMKKKKGRMVPNCVPANEAFEAFMQSMGNKPSEREWGTNSLTNLYKKMTPGEKKAPKKKALSQEAAEASVQGGMSFGADGIGPTIAVPRAGTPYGFGYGSAYSMGLSESIVTWMNSERTQQKFADKYGNLWEEKIVEAALRLEDAGCGCEHTKMKKSVKKVREGMEGGVNNMSMIPIQRKGDQEANEQTEMEVMPRDYANKFVTPKVDPSRKPQYMKARRHKEFIAQNYHPEKIVPAMHEESEDVIDTSKIKSLKAYKKNIHPQSETEKASFAEESPAWTRKEGKSSSGGLNRKGIASYRRANPGSKLSMAVTTKPSKLKKGSKAANRRKSFCARMGGMKKRLTSAKTARDPNSRINKALRKWNCEE